MSFVRSAKKTIKKISFISNLNSKIKAKQTVNWDRLNKNIIPNTDKTERYKVLLATGTGHYQMGVLLESSLASALNQRGADVDVLLCDGALSGCMMARIDDIQPEIMASEGPKSRCGDCISFGKAIFDGSFTNKLFYSNFLSEEDKSKAKNLSETIEFKDIRNYKYGKIAIGEHAYAGALRYFARGDLKGEQFGEKILREYLSSAMLTVFSLNALFDQEKYDVVCFHHGIYVPQGLVTQVCQARNIRLVTWNPAYKKNTFIFSHDDTYHHTMISENVAQWENFDLSKERKSKILDYLESRKTGANDWIWFHDTPQENIEKIKTELGCRLDRPAIGLFTNVIWDAQLHYKSSAFENMLDWIHLSIDYFSTRPDLELLIRIHPAEMRGAIPSRHAVLDEIKEKHPNLAENIFVIPPESQISSYTVMELCNAVTIFNTKTGIEVSSSGIPTIVAGEAWIRNKGFSFDASSPEHYVEMLKNLPFKEKMSEADTERALKYAYHFFMRRMIPLPFINFDPISGKYSSNLKCASELSYGKIKGLDVICDGILDGTPFEFDENEGVNAAV